MEIQKTEGEQQPVEVTSGLKQGLGEPFTEYRGDMLIRPCGRGTMLLDMPGQDGIEDLYPEGKYRIEFKLWRK